MEISNQYSAYPESYKGVDGLVSMLKQNLISGEQTEFPFRFTTNLVWTQDDIDSAISEVINLNGSPQIYYITYESGIFSIDFYNK